jgi:hypothetical protein
MLLSTLSNNMPLGMSLKQGLNIVTKQGTGQGVQMKIVIGEYLQRNCMVATHSW